MPWKAFQNDKKDAWCIYHVDADGNKKGEAVNCSHDSEESANAQIRAMHSGMAREGTKEMHTGMMIALFPNENDAQQINALSQNIEGLQTGDGDQTHLTLHYLGDSVENPLPPDTIEALKTALAKFASEQDPIQASINGVGRFQDNDPNAMYVNADSPRLPEFRAQLDSLLKEFELGSESDHGFTPHITLGYLPADAPTPDIKIEPFPIKLDDMRLCIAGDHYQFPLGNVQSPEVVEQTSEPESEVTPESSAEIISPLEEEQTKAGRYAHIDFKPPSMVEENARRALALRKEHRLGGNPVAWARARDLSNGSTVSPRTVRRMVGFFARHNTPVEQKARFRDKTSNAYISWMMWGGDAGREWATNIAQQMHRADTDKSFRVYRDTKGDRYMLLISATAYKDREDEWIESKAMQEDTDRRWKDDQYVSGDPLMFWHDDPDTNPERAIGTIIWGDCDGPFLIELAKENHSQYGVKEFGQSYSETIWDYIENHPEIPWGASIGYTYLSSQKTADKVYKAIRKFETSVLPLDRASNPHTFAGVTMTKNTNRDKLLANIFNDEVVKSLRSTLANKSEMLKKAGVTHKAFQRDLENQEKLKESKVAKNKANMPAEETLEAVKDDTFATSPEGDTSGVDTSMNDMPMEETDDQSPEAIADEILALLDQTVSQEDKKAHLVAFITGLMDNSSDPGESMEPSEGGDTSAVTDATLALNKSLIETQKALAEEFVNLSQSIAQRETARKSVDDNLKGIVEDLNTRLKSIESKMKMAPRPASRDTKTQLTEEEEAKLKTNTKNENQLDPFWTVR